jgi:hypothetical protein
MSDTEKPIPDQGAAASAAENRPTIAEKEPAARVEAAEDGGHQGGGRGASPAKREHQLGLSEEHGTQARLRPTEPLAAVVPLNESPNPVKALAPTVDDLPFPAVSGQEEPPPGPGRTVPGEPPLLDPLPEPAHGYGAAQPATPGPRVPPTAFGPSASAQAPLPSPLGRIAGPQPASGSRELLWITALIGSLLLVLLGVAIGALLWQGRSKDEPQQASALVPSTSFTSEIAPAPPPAAPATVAAAPSKLVYKATPKAKTTTRSSASTPPKQAPSGVRATRTRPTGMR